MKKLFLLFGFFLSQSASNPIFENGAVGMFGDKYQGDIKLNKAQEILLFDKNSRNQSTKTGWTWEGFRWPTDTHGLVTVPYAINYSGAFCMRFIF